MPFAAQGVGNYCLVWFSVLVYGWVTAVSMGRHQLFELLPASHMYTPLSTWADVCWWSIAAIYGWTPLWTYACTCWCSLGPDKWAAVAPASPGPEDLCLREKDAHINHCSVWRENVMWILLVCSWLIHLFFLPDLLIDYLMFLTLCSLYWSIMCGSLHIHFGCFHKRRIFPPLLSGF